MTYQETLNSIGYHSTLENIPKEYRTAELLARLVNHNSTVLDKLDETERTEQFFLALLNLNIGGISIIPKKYRTTDIKVNLIDKFYYARRYLSIDEYTDEVFNKLEKPLNKKYANCSLLVKSYIFKHNCALIRKSNSTCFKNVPVIKEFESVALPPRKGYELGFFNDVSKDFIITEVYPYLENHIKWALSTNAIFSNIFGMKVSSTQNHLADMFFDDILNYLEELLPTKRKKYITWMSEILLHLEDKPTRERIINTFPELKLKILNK